jgi:GntR family transcriptional regulator/MocR family aminotransferase
MSRQPAGASLNLVLDPAADVPLHRQIYEGVREAILSGRLAPRTRLASSRSTATDLAVSRATVVAAFDQLAAEGYVVSRVGSGMRVSSALPDDLTGATAPGASQARSSTRPRLGAVGRLEAMARLRPSDAATPFWPANPSVHSFPLEDWTRRLARRWRSATASQLEYGHPAIAG